MGQNLSYVYSVKYTNSQGIGTNVQKSVQITVCCLPEFGTREATCCSQVPALNSLVFTYRILHHIKNTNFENTDLLYVSMLRFWQPS